MTTRNASQFWHRADRPCPRCFGAKQVSVDPGRSTFECGTVETITRTEWSEFSRSLTNKPNYIKHSSHRVSRLEVDLQRIADWVAKASGVLQAVKAVDRVSTELPDTIASALLDTVPNAPVGFTRGPRE